MAKRAMATLTHGRDGGRAVAWIAGVPHGFTRQYLFPAGQPLVIDDADAEALKAGKITTGGRRFDVVLADKPASTSAGGGASKVAIPAGSEDKGG